MRHRPSPSFPSPKEKNANNCTFLSSQGPGRRYRQGAMSGRGGSTPSEPSRTSHYQKAVWAAHPPGLPETGAPANLHSQQVLTFQSSSSLLICWAVICLARSCSCSEGILTSQDKKQRSWIRGCHWELSQLMSLRLLWLAQGCLQKPPGGRDGPR